MPSSTVAVVVLTALSGFGGGAYQPMLAGRGGVHHCLAAEPRRLIVEADPDLSPGGFRDGLIIRQVAPQSLTSTMRLLGYSDPMGISVVSRSTG